MRRPAAATPAPEVREVFVWWWWETCIACRSRVYWEAMWTWTRSWYIPGLDGGTETLRVCEACARDYDTAALIKRQIG